MKIRVIKKGNREKPKVKIIKRSPTFKQSRVIAIVRENAGKVGSKAEVLRQAGYGPDAVNNPERVFNSPAVKEALDPIVRKMREIRTKVLDALDEKDFSKESAFNLTMISGMLTKDSELLDGRPTSRDGYQITESEKEHIRRLLEKNRKK
ncbi:hypothetical protein A2737_02315 [Candidatus Nomurabacteria bacterium RIFCSPHIGHO2_01_FULL_41_71]|nr:MAG: hypothetical protein A2737_02315 [Candidatus Nomurabacteria bacterium RIFCSPHIGHO2_01_FULL_41_71]OGI89547.1 MAG: hypothetical protein A3B01_00130 [Candidatus Nomurabacteria bacterium RIFCSPLOWO2_01_FULL_41_52b]